MEKTIDGMPEFMVIYTIAAEGPQRQYFKCWAENDEHAREQCRDAYPNCHIVDVRRKNP